MFQYLSEEWRVGFERSALGKGAGGDGVDAEVVDAERSGLGGLVVEAPHCPCQDA
jgi:hypothetical protein